ncbi:MAG: hypothetical protein IJE00_02010 [Clostridia bacterium]|nr:hypothetical protein [Clostridia bacterium]MBQ2939121.1 hypothetical protein [Clostridia bacterium]
MNLLSLMLAATTAPTTEAAPQMFFQPVNFVTNLQYMGIGMLVIFAVIGIIILATLLINYLFSD